MLGLNVLGMTKSLLGVLFDEFSVSQPLDVMYIQLEPVT